MYLLCSIIASPSGFLVPYMKRKVVERLPLSSPVAAQECVALIRWSFVGIAQNPSDVPITFIRTHGVLPWPQN